MKNNTGILDFFNKKFIGLSFVLIILIPFVLSAQPFSNAAANKPFQPGSEGAPAGGGQTNASQSALVYSPFSPYAPSPLPTGNSPVLYGPGGDPIGGLPMENGSIVLLGLVLAYVFFRLVHTRFWNKRTRIY